MRTLSLLHLLLLLLLLLRLLLLLLSLSLSSLAHTKAYVHIAYESAHCGRGHGDVCVLHYVHDVQRHMNTWHVSVTFCADT